MSASVKEKLRRVLTALNGNPELPVDEHPLVREKKAMRDRAAYDLEHTVLRAPLDGGRWDGQAERYYLVRITSFEPAPGQEGIAASASSGSTPR